MIDNPLQTLKLSLFRLILIMITLFYCMSRLDKFVDKYFDYRLKLMQQTEIEKRGTLTKQEEEKRATLKEMEKYRKEWDKVQNNNALKLMREQTELNAQNTLNENEYKARIIQWSIEKDVFVSILDTCNLKTNRITDFIQCIDGAKNGAIKTIGLFNDGEEEQNEDNNITAMQYNNENDKEEK